MNKIVKINLNVSNFKSKIIKKLIMVVFTCLLCITPVYSADIPGEYNIAPKFVRATTNMLGYNNIMKGITKKSIKKALNKNLKGNYSIKIDSYSGVDLKKGKFESLTIDGKNLCLDDSVYFTSLHLKTTSQFNYVDYRKRPMRFMTDVPMRYIIEITDDDLNRMISQDNFLNYLLEVIPFVEIDRFNVEIENDEIVICTTIKLPMGKTIKLLISGQPRIEDGKIILKDVKTTGIKREFADKISRIINNYNLLENIKLHIFSGTSTVMSLKNIRIINNKIFIDGTIVVKKA